MYSVANRTQRRVIAAERDLPLRYGTDLDVIFPFGATKCHSVVQDKMIVSNSKIRYSNHIEYWSHFVGTGM